jgi:hypothetical protein
MNWIKFFRNIYIRKVLGFALVFLAIFSFALPLWADFIFAIILQIIIDSLKEAIVLALILLLTSLFLSFLWGDRGSSGIWYREHEKWAVGQKYIPLVKDVVQQPFGDLVATNRSSTFSQINALKEPRTVRFQTDKFGYRNSKDISKAKFVFVGDSFIVGNGTDQSEIASEWFGKFTDENIANVAFPGIPEQYEERMLSMINNIDKNASLIIFYYEGNDFYRSSPPNLNFSLLSKISINYDKLELQKDRALVYLHPRDQTLFRLIRRSSYTINTKIRDIIKRNRVVQTNETNNMIDNGNKNQPLENKSSDEVVEIRQVGEKLIGFIGYENLATEQNNLKAHIFQDSYLLSRIDAVVFIPTKWRVYSQWVSAEPTESAFNFLSESYSKLNIPVYDLSKILSVEASRLLPDNKYVYWRDDSHWNGYGIKAAMEYLAQEINSTKSKNKFINQK